MYNVQESSFSLARLSAACRSDITAVARSMLHLLLLKGARIALDVQFTVWTDATFFLSNFRSENDMNDVSSLYVNLRDRQALINCSKLHGLLRSTSQRFLF